MKTFLLFLLLAFFGNGKKRSLRRTEEVELGEYFDSDSSVAEDSSESDSQVNWDEDEIAVGELEANGMWVEDLEDELSSPLLNLYAAHLTDDEEVALGSWDDDLHRSGKMPAQILGERGVGSRKQYLTRWEGERIPDWQTLDQLELSDHKKPDALLDWEEQKRQTQVGDSRDGRDNNEYADDARYDYDELEQMVGDIYHDIENDGFEHRRSLFMTDMVEEAEQTLDITPKEGPTAAKDTQDQSDEAEEKSESNEIKEDDETRKKSEDKVVKNLGEKKIEDDEEKKSDKEPFSVEDGPAMKSLKSKLKELEDMKEMWKTQDESVKNSDNNLKSMESKKENSKLKSLRTKASLLQKVRSQDREKKENLLKKLSNTRSGAMEDHGEMSKRAETLGFLKKIHSHLVKMVKGEDKEKTKARLKEIVKKKALTELPGTKYNVDLPKNERMTILSKQKGKRLRSLLKGMNIDDELSSQIFKVLNNKEWADSGMKKYMRLQARKKKMKAELKDLYSQRKEQKKQMSQKKENLSDLLSQLLEGKGGEENSAKGKENVKTLVIGPEDLNSPERIHERAQEGILRHLHDKSIIYKMKDGKKKIPAPVSRSKTHKEHLDQLRKMYPFIDDFFGEYSPPAPKKKESTTKSTTTTTTTTRKPMSRKEIKAHAKKELEEEKKEKLKKEAVQKAEEKAKEDEGGPLHRGKKVLKATGFSVKLPTKRGLKKKRYSRFAVPTPKTRACVSSCCPCGFRRVRWSYKDGCYNVEGTCATCSSSADKKLEAVGFSYVYNPAVKKTLPLFTFRRTGAEWKKSPNYKSKCPSGKVLTGLGTIVTKYEQKLKHSMRIKCASGTDPRVPKESLTFESMP